MPRERFTPSGINLDLPPTEIDPNIYTDGENFVFRRGIAQQASSGVEVFGTLLGPPLDVFSSIDFELNAWLYPTDDGITKAISVTDGNTSKPITPTGFIPWVDSEANSFTDGNISGFPFINWGAQSAYWTRDFATPALMTLIVGLNTDPTPIEAPGWVPVAKAMRGHQNRVMCINTNDDPGTNFPASEETLIWSSLPADVTSFPNDFFPRVTNSAGSVQLSGGGPLIDGQSLRSSFIVYGQDRTWIMDEIGGTFTFAVRKLSSSTGALSRNCVASTPLGHVVLSGDDVYINDGQSFRSIIDNENKVNLFTNMGDNWFSSFVVYYAARAEVWICIPTGADVAPTRAYIWDTGTLKWGIRSFASPIPGADTGPIPFPSTNDPSWDGQTQNWDDATRVWNQAVLASAASGLILADPDIAGSGVAPRFVSIDNLVNGPEAGLFSRSFISRTDLDLGDDSRLKTVLRIWPRISGRFNLTIQVKIGARDTLDGAPAVFTGFTPFVIGRQQKVDMIITGRYISVEFSIGQQGKGEVWTIDGFDMEYEIAGEF